jgi:hypothetical protein
MEERCRQVVLSPDIDTQVLDIQNVTTLILVCNLVVMRIHLHDSSAVDRMISELKVFCYGLLAILE